ncbi:type II toxin-antitoxin system prevent-host-death family antitoxin [Granulicella aggregans]|uniref:type II toxin-antitoxin system prevent-host-death family antitoxin n=1 Tax=Granulicella aggregans TaxID=474949 RepID=UPI0021E0879B|nr:type II toxin-antitoxin system prevent-host-death family antitoxin [Granulicella aggregans]
MGTWQAVDAEARFSALLDAAADEGPQVIRQKGRTFVITAKQDQQEEPVKAAESEPKKFVSAWEALRPSFEDRFDLELPERDWQSRPVDLG